MYCEGGGVHWGGMFACRSVFICVCAVRVEGCPGVVCLPVGVCLSACVL